MSGSQFPRVTRAVLALATALAFAACGDSTGPDTDDITVTVSVDGLDAPVVYERSPGAWVIECHVELSATATGPATWLDATLLFYAGPHRATPIDSVQIAAADIQGAWGAPGIAPGQTQHVTWSASASIPFGASIVHRYKTSHGRIRSAEVRFTCGPDLPPVVVPPAISNLTLQPASGEIEPGDALTVQYSAASEMGLWTTRVTLTGACTEEREVAERFVHTVTRTIVIPIPRTCTLGAPLAVTVFATDAAAQRTTAAAPQALAVVDRTPPQVWGQNWPVGTRYYFVGDTLQPQVGAFDNHSVQSVIWEVEPGGVRDSVLGPGGWFVSIPIRPEWAGQKIQIRLFARDASGLVSDTLIAPLDSLGIYPSVTRPTMSTTLAGEDAEDLVIDQARGALYLMQQLNRGRVSVFSLAERRITETIPLPTGAMDLDLTVSGDSLVLALPYSRGLGIIDLSQSSRTVTLLPLRSLDSTLSQAPYQVRVAANGKAYVGLAGPSAAANRLLEVDLGTGAERLLTDAGHNGLTGGAGFDRSFDRTVLVLAQRFEDLLQRYDVAADAFGPIQSRVNVGGPLRIDRTGAHVSVGLDIYDGDLAFQRRVAAPYPGLYVPGAALSPDGEYLYQAIALGGIARTRTSDGVLLDRSPTPFSASGYLRMSPDGTMLVIMDSFNGTLKIATMDLR
jgi:hypothetical protein